MDNHIKCPACGAFQEVNAKICSECGHNLAGTTEAFDPLELSGGDVNLPVLSQGTPHLTLTKGPSKGGVFYLEEFPITVGRDPDCDIFLNNRTVSRQHAIIEHQGDRIIVRDNHSLNGTWVDGSIVEEAELTDSCLLQIGTFSMRFNL
ncbi:MAG: FHA domain-containing protein [Coriobacteriales bacterium]|jgi:pSer/pThr/pTyr-binding forkhead associated (FHA) protein|nr:FHA domain-containing protein [Coriobacteriales bacterium]